MIIFENTTTAIDVQQVATESIYIAVIVYDDVQCGRFLPQSKTLEVEDVEGTYKVFNVPETFLDALLKNPMEVASYYFIFAR